MMIILDKVLPHLEVMVMEDVDFNQQILVQEPIDVIQDVVIQDVVIQDVVIQDVVIQDVVIQTLIHIDIQEENIQIEVELALIHIYKKKLYIILLKI